MPELGRVSQARHRSLQGFPLGDCPTHLSYQPIQIVAYIALGLGQIADPAVAGHNVLGLQRHGGMVGRLPRLQPAPGQDAEHPVGEDQVAAEQHLLFRHPDHGIAGKVSIARAEQPEAPTTQHEGLAVGGNRLGGIGRHRTVQTLFQRGPQHRSHCTPNSCCVATVRARAMICAPCAAKWPLPSQR